MRKRRTHEDFVNDVYEKYKDEYTVLGTFINTKIKVLVRHNPCGLEYEVNPTNLLRGYKCMNCYGKPQKDTEQFKEEVRQILGDNYEVVGKYKTNRTNIKIYHKKCNSTYSMLPFNILRGYKCPICSKKFKKTTDYFKEEIKKLKNDEYELLSEYINTNTKVLIRHKICNQTFEVIPDNFINKDSNCPFCASKFKGEERIKDFLENNSIYCIRQYKINECKNTLPLPFDFAIFKDNNLQCLIEYDGIQHFEPVSAFGGEKSFLKTQGNDKIKNDFCELNHLKLIRISYYDYKNIDNILSENILKSC